MAVIDHATKVLSLSPIAYYKCDEASGALDNLGSLGASMDLAVTGSPTYRDASLLKDGSDYGVRLPTGSFASSGAAVTAANGFSLSCLLKVNTLPSTTTNFITVGVQGSNSDYAQMSIRTAGLRFVVGTTGGAYERAFEETAGMGQTARVYHLLLVCDYDTETVTSYIDGVQTTAVSGTALKPLSGRNIAIATGNGGDFTIDEISLYDYALNAGQSLDLWRSTRAIDEDAVDVYVGVSGSTFATGTDADPIDYLTSTRFGLASIPGARIVWKGGEYAIQYRVRYEYAGLSGSPITVTFAEGELVEFDIQTAAGWVFEFTTASAYMDFIGQTYAKAGGIAGFVIRHSSTRRIAYKNGADPVMDSGTLTNDNFATTDSLTVLQGHEGLDFVLYNSGVEQFRSEIIDTVTPKSVTLADSYGGTQALGGTWTAEIEGTASHVRLPAGAITAFGTRIRIINPIVHDTGDALSIWEQSVNSMSYGGVLQNIGWNGPLRGGGFPTYQQNNNTTQSSTRDIIGYAALAGFAGNGKAYGASGYADAINLEDCVFIDSAGGHIVFYHDTMPTKTATGTTTASSASMPYTDGTGTLAANDFIRIKGAGRSGQDFFTRIVSVAGGTATLRRAPFTSVVGAVVTAGWDEAALSFLIGSGAFDKPSNDITVSNNDVFCPRDGRYSGGIQIGYEAEYNVNAAATDNYIVANSSLVSKDWRDWTATGNTLVNEFSTTTYSSNHVEVQTEDNAAPTTQVYDVDGNAYHMVNHPLNSGLRLPFKISGILNRFGTANGLPWADANATNDPNSWTEYGFDAAGSYSESAPTTNVVRVKPQDARGQIGRANICIYNWELLSEVEVDLSTTGLVDGQAFEIRDLEDFFNTVLVSGTYSAASPTVMVPTTDFQRAQPTGWTEMGLSDIPSLKPEFVGGVLLPFAISETPSVTLSGGVSISGGVSLG